MSSWRGLGWALGALAAAGCAGPPRPPPAAAAPPPVPSGPVVEKVREELQIAPWDLALSAAPGQAGPPETVSARNMADAPVEVRAILVLGEDARLFRLDDLPELPARVPPRGRVSVSVALAPPASAALGVHRAILRFQTGPTTEDGAAADLAALVTRGRAGEGEPALQEVVEALGFAVDTRMAPLGPQPALASTSASASSPAAAPADRPRGDEIEAPLFQRASATPVALNPVARFSADGRRAYGYYVVEKGRAVTHEIGALPAGQNQTLNPELEAGGQTSFDPGEGAFGLWLRTGKRVFHSDDARNSAANPHAARVFPLRARGGAPIANAYLVAFDEGVRGDFQDGVFVLWNVKPAAAR
jgi:hypothetical protein